MNTKQSDEIEERMEDITEILPHLILGNAEELYNNPDGEMAKLTISEMQRVILEQHNRIVDSLRSQEAKRVEEAYKAGQSDLIYALGNSFSDGEHHRDEFLLEAEHQSKRLQALTDKKDV